MTDREKVIKGLEHIQGLTSLQCLNFPSERMEFHNLIADALVLLKEQEKLIEEAEELGFDRGQKNILEAQAGW